MFFLILLVLLVVSIPVTHQGLSSPPASCCTKVARNIPRNMLRKVSRVQIQKKDGICNIAAIVLHVNLQLKCLDPRNQFLQQWVRRHHPQHQ
ncbi:C-C motif chemokine 28-like [Engystomops pustulosus]|uniref:C-C motif chemokine 28-like n=1 Tax=Engystomops pustulosus TaxID=76066 RepID=UPI003AFAA2CA